jgi:thiol peroxidase
LAIFKEHKRTVTVNGNPLTLVGNEVRVGDKAPDFTVLKQDFSEAKLSDYKGKVCILSAVGSLDTPTCDAETRRFNAEAANLGSDVSILTISMDLPFALKRWCGAAGVDKVEVFSDYRDIDFGNKYGVLINESRLLARCLFVLDRESVIRYIQLVPEISDEPNYEEVLKAVKELI